MALRKKSDELYLVTAGKYEDFQNIAVFTAFRDAEKARKEWDATPGLPRDMKAEITTIKFNPKPRG